MPTSTTADDDAAVVIPPAPDATDNKTATTGDDLDASKSDDKTVVTDDDKSTETTTKTDDALASQFDDDLDDWIKSRKAPLPQTDEERQSYQDLRNEQRQFHSERQAKKDADELAKATQDAKPADDSDDDDLDDEEKRLKKIEDSLAAERTTRIQSEFYTSNKVTPEQHKEILTLIKEKVARPTTDDGKRKAAEYWTSTDALPDLLDLAKARVSTASQSTVAEEAARAEREKIERESNAKSPGRNATSTQTSDKTEDQARLERFKARYNK